MTASSRLTQLPFRLVVSIAFLNAVGALATDLYLPAFPEMAAELGGDASGAQLTLTAFLVGVAVGQLVLGFVSDRWGRRRPLIAGAVVCALASGALVLAPGLPFLLVARFVQGAAGAAGMVIGRAIIADLVSGRSAARAFSLMLTVGGLAPIVAPVLGGLLVGPIGWRGILAVLFGLTVAMVAVVVLVIPETLPVERRTKPRASTRSDQPDIPGLRGLVSPVFLGNAAMSICCFAVLLAYISASPFLYEELLGLTPEGYGVAFAGNSVALVAGTFTSARLVRRFRPRAVLTVGMAIMITSIVSIAVIAFGDVGRIGLAVSLPALLFGFGLVQGNAAAAAITSVPRAAGAASAVIGCGQFSVSAVSAALVGVGGSDAVVSLAVVLIGCLLLMLAAHRLSRTTDALGA
ncbi:multidrug effflux MFS transporter [Cnuibacter physcomitrellae]|uniref:multidrug effflux MFS transporter n=1 Tax=Cnuibacter physcomitrellae TaxID=1619308 RepID=UPI0021760CD2|nr:multidrug effflux MFS transporter [Cnuibacter physcomitrellae]MCS5498299.1 multidrug effflux MFS transporter [Cnuibacter physcomitrellae]